MEVLQHRCQECGGELHITESNLWVCNYCGNVYEEHVAEQNTKNMRAMFDEAKQEIVCNLRRNLYDAVNAEYISTIDVKSCCLEIKKYLPDDFAANFYEIAVSNNVKRLTKYIRHIDVQKNYCEIDSIIRFLTKSLQTEYLLELNNLVERAYKARDLSLFEKYSTQISKEAEKVVNGVYEVKMPREVFVAYSSKDMEKVSELVEVLEEQGLNCFVAARNLRHGKGSVENYDSLLKEAMDHCRSFVFVSSANSRSFNCDALIKELPYVQQKDVENAPAEYKNSYGTMPHRLKKPRVEYRIEESLGFNAADSISNEFFDGYERVYSPEEVAERVVKQLVRSQEEKAAPARPVPKPVVTEKQVVTTVAPANSIEALLKRISIFLEDNDMESADRYCEKVLDIDPENARAYVAKLMIDLGVNCQDDLVNCATPFDDNGNYKRAIRFADEELAEQLKGYIVSINERNEIDRKNSIYASACDLMKDRSVSSYQKAISTFGMIPSWLDSKEQIQECKKCIEEIKVAEEIARKDGIYDKAEALAARKCQSTYESMATIKEAIVLYNSIPNWKDSNQKAKECLNKFQQLKATLEEERKEKERQEEITRQKVNKFLKISSVVTVAICVVIAIAVLLNNVIIPRIQTVNKYNNAIALMESGQYTQAKAEFEALDGYKDSAQHIINCNNAIEQARREAKYQEAIKLMDKGEYEKAIKEFNSVSGYKDSANKITACQTAIKDISYNKALALMEEGKYAEAIVAFEALNGHSDSADKIIECQTAIKDISYQDALALMNEGKYAEAIVAFEALNGHSDSADKIIECQTAIKDISYEDALALMNDGKYAEAIVAFEALNGHSDSADKIIACQTAIKDISYQDALALMNEGKYAEAAKTFEKLGEYKDSADLLAECNNYLDFTFTLHDASDGYMKEGYSITLYKGDRSELTLPSMYMGLPVTSIEYRAFADCRNLTKIIIPEGITYIAANAFSDCINLTEISIPKTVNYMGSSILLGCKNLRTLTIPFLGSYANDDSVNSFLGFSFGSTSNIDNANYVPDSLKYVTVTSQNKISGRAFYGCSSIVGITLPNDLVSIGARAFSKCENLESIIIPSNVTTIGVSAFSNCSRLHRVTMNDGITDIENYAFSYCQALNSIIIPKSINSIGDYAFVGCDELESITYLGTAEEFANVTKGTNWNYSVSVTFKPQCDGVNHYVEILAAVEPTCTENGLTEGSRCYGCGAIIVEQKSVAAHHDEVTHEAKAPTCTEVGWDAYVTCTRCDYTTYVEKPIENHDIVEYSAKEPTCSDVGWFAYEECSKCDYTTYVEKPIENHDIVEYSAQEPTCSDVGWFAYEECSKCDYTTYVEKPIDDSKHQYNYENICTICQHYSDEGVVFTLSNGYFTVSDYTGNASEVIIPSTYMGKPVTSIGEDAFNGCSSLESIEIPSSVTSIGDWAFENCSSLTSIEIPSSVTSIGEYTFNNCTSLESIEIPSSVTSIGEYTFNNCTSLESIEIPSSVTSIGESAFEGCTSLTSITLPFVGETKNGTNNTHFGYIFGASYYSSNSSYVPTSLKTVVITGGTSIGDSAFCNCDSLTSIEIPSSVTSIGDWAFDYCSSLTSIEIPSSVTSIGDWAFDSCSSLTSIEIPSSVTSIGGSAFCYCTSLESIEIPSSVTSIGEHAFYKCSSLESIEIPSSVTSIGGSAFCYCTSLTSIEIPSSVTSIGDWAFENCSSLTSIEIPSSVTSIGEYTFNNC
ncbi:MAG: hypothetical protein E7649_07930, partial [Ruminococcaceae bacterium]|nr:hypothetical protein [Oscillospiraceae bacterium]